MIKKLRRKFVASNMLFVSLVLLAVFIGQILSSYQRASETVERAQYQALEWIMGDFSPSFVFQSPPDNSQWKNFHEKYFTGREEADQQRFFLSVPTFAVQVNAEGQICALRTGPGVEVEAETAQEIVDAALTQNRSHGTLSSWDLNYLVKEEETATYLSFADNSSIRTSLRNQLFTSLLICSGAMLAFYIISRFLAKRSLRPVEQAWEQQRQFVADASHELKTPLTVILANTDIVLTHPDDTIRQQNKWIQYIKEEAEGMRTLVEDLLFLAKYDAARQPSQLIPVQLSELVSGSLLPFESVAFEHGVSLIDHISPNINVQGDGPQLKRLVAILLDNAIKYAGAKGTVTVTLDESAGRPRLTVHNTGPAIPPEHLPHLFERFYRADAARDRDQGGYGLGLPIAKSIADSHNGRLTVTSTPETGTTFTMLFSRK